MISGRRLGFVIFALGGPACVLATALDPDAARSAAAQDWPAFVLVSGLLLVGVVASEAGLFEAIGARLARLPARELTRFVCAAALVGIVSALLNLDTAAAFLTPVLVHMARKRGSREAPLLYGCLLLTNAGSLLLPGSNLTNIIVAGHLHLVGATFASRMAPAWAVALIVTALVVAVVHRRELLEPSTSGLSADLTSLSPNRHTLAAQSVAAQSVAAQSVAAQSIPAESGAQSIPAESVAAESRTATQSTEIQTNRLSASFAGTVIVATAVVVVTLQNAALLVVAIGLVAVAVELASKRLAFRSATEALDLPLLAGLLGVAIALGTLGRTWDLPARVLSHLGTFATAGFAAVTSIVFNNLPAASLLSARVPSHPYSLLVGLDLGPNLFVTGSLSALLWFRAARQAGAEPSLRHTAFLGIIATPLAIVASVAVLSAGVLSAGVL